MSTPQAIHDHPYADFIHEVEKPTRYLGGEYLAVRKERRPATTTVCLAFPDLYDIGMSHLGTKILYKLLNDRPDIACERAFTPWPDMEAKLREKGLPLVSLETATPLGEFDVLGMSLQYELTYTNVLTLLDLAGLPLRAKDRTDAHPLVIAGGPTATHPEPIAPFLDALLIGDAEEALPVAMAAVGQWRRDGMPKRQQLKRLAAMGGWYCPALYETTIDERNDLEVVDPARSEGPYPVVKAQVDDLNRYPFPDDSPVAAAEAIFDRLSIEIARGCTEGCRFCQAGMIYRPVRERSPEQIVDTVVAALKRGGYDQVSLTSLSTADFSCVSPLVKDIIARLRKDHIGLSIASLRAYGLSGDLLDEVRKVKANGLTFAPEAGTQRMRDVINKNVSDDDIERTCHNVFSRGWKKMKFYFILGLPTETDEDVAGIIETAGRARRIGQQYHRKSVDVTASVSSHVPKPHTPFQWAAMDSIAEVERKQNMLRQLAAQHRVKFKKHDLRGTYIECILSRGDRRLADVVEAVWRAGCRFDGWDNMLDWKKWLAATEQFEIDPQRYLGTLPVDGRLPWDHIDVKLEPKFLAREWKRALGNKLSPPCGKPVGMQVHHDNIAQAATDKRILVCYHCGLACDMKQMRAERIDYLKQLGAYEPPKSGMDQPSGMAFQAMSPDSQPEETDALEGQDVRSSEPVEQLGAASGGHGLEGRATFGAAVRTDRNGRILPPLRTDDTPGYRYRLLFTKLGTIALTSQLDLTRLLPRAFRRADLKMKFSAGFVPHPLCSYGPALNLGVASIGETMDVTFEHEHDPDEIIARINEVADPGLIITAAARIADRAHAVSRVAKIAEVILAAPRFWSEAMIEDAIARLSGDEPLPVSIKRKDVTKIIDVRDGHLGATLDRADEREVDLLGIGPDTPVLRYRINLNTGAHVRPTELLQGAFGIDGRPADLVQARVALWGLGKSRVYDLLDDSIGIDIDPGDDLHAAMASSATLQAWLTANRPAGFALSAS